jgi:hypothetical protein
VEGVPARFGAPGESFPEELVAAVGRLRPGTELCAGGGALARSLSRRLGRPVQVASLAEWREGRRRLPSEEPAAERAYLLVVARHELARALRSPEEVLITLAREEERLERAVGREDRAAEAFLAVPGSSLEEYSERWSKVREELRRHHAALASDLDRATRRMVPNLAALVGSRVAARWVAAAGGIEPLGRMRAPRLQLLGSRRRPSPERGPRYGIIYRADRMADVPPGRRGAFARSLAALASIAARADATTHREIVTELLRRRDRRVAQLARRRG